MSTKIIGLWSSKDCSYSIMEDGIITLHNEYERFIREKEPAGDSIQFMFDTYNDWHDVDYLATVFPTNKVLQYKQSCKILFEQLSNNNGKPIVVGHHQAHAANAFYSSNFDEALIITMDGGGKENEDTIETAFTLWKGKDKYISPIKIYPMHEVNIGGIWSKVCRFIFRLSAGWPKGSTCGSIMAMTSYGDASRFHDDFYKMLTKDLAAASHKPANTPKGDVTPNDPRHPYLSKWRDIADKSEQDQFDLAAGLQSATEQYMREILTPWINKCGDNINICLAGGVSLNSVATGKFKEWFPQINNMYATPTPGDHGMCIGASQYLWYQILENERIVYTNNFSPYLGRVYLTDEIINACNDVAYQ